MEVGERCGGQDGGGKGRRSLVQAVKNKFSEQSKLEEVTPHIQK